MTGEKKKAPFDWSKYPSVIEAGTTFAVVPAKDAEDAFPSIRKRTRGVDSDRYYYFPRPTGNIAPEFPERPQLENFFSFLRSGIAKHNLSVEEMSAIDGRSDGFSARQLTVFDSDVWSLECLRVLSHYGWIDGDGSNSPWLLEKLNEALGKSVIDSAEEQYGQGWEAYLLELAAIQLAEPFSRLWYVANMWSLYFATEINRAKWTQRRPGGKGARARRCFTSIGSG